MKRTMSAIMIMALLSFWVPCVYAEVSRDLDPMMPADPQATVASESSTNNTVTSGASNVASTADAAGAGEKAGEKKADAKKKTKSKKSSTKKSSSSKSSKSVGDHSSKQTKKRKKISN